MQRGPAGIYLDLEFLAAVLAKASRRPEDKVGREFVAPSPAPHLKPPGTSADYLKVCVCERAAGFRVW